MHILLYRRSSLHKAYVCSHECSLARSGSELLGQHIRAHYALETFIVTHSSLYVVKTRADIEKRTGVKLFFLLIRFRMNKTKKNGRKIFSFFVAIKVLFHIYFFIIGNIFLHVLEHYGTRKKLGAKKLSRGLGLCRSVTRT